MGRIGRQGDMGHMNANIQGLSYDGRGIQSLVWSLFLCSAGFGNVGRFCFWIALLTRGSMRTRVGGGIRRKSSVAFA